MNDYDEIEAMQDKIEAMQKEIARQQMETSAKQDRLIANLKRWHVAMNVMMVLVVAFTIYALWVVVQLADMPPLLKISVSGDDGTPSVRLYYCDSDDGADCAAVKGGAL